jgi:hypothetical protein
LVETCRETKVECRRADWSDGLRKGLRIDARASPVRTHGREVHRVRITALVERLGRSSEFVARVEGLAQYKLSAG